MLTTIKPQYAAHQRLSLGQIVDSRRVAELLLTHGEPYKLIGLTPGASFGRDQRLDRPSQTVAP